MVLILAISWASDCNRESNSSLVYSLVSLFDKLLSEGVETGFFPSNSAVATLADQNMYRMSW